MQQELLRDLCLDLLLAVAAQLLEAGSPFLPNLLGSGPCTAAAEELPVPISTRQWPEADAVPSTCCHLKYCHSVLAQFEVVEHISVPFQGRHVLIPGFHPLTEKTQE